MEDTAIRDFQVLQESGGSGVLCPQEHRRHQAHSGGAASQFAAGCQFEVRAGLSARGSEVGAKPQPNFRNHWHLADCAKEVDLLGGDLHRVGWYQAAAESGSQQVW